MLDSPLGALMGKVETIREKRDRYIRFDSIWTALEGRQGLDDQDTTSVRPGDVRHEERRSRPLVVGSSRRWTCGTATQASRSCC